MISPLARVARIAHGRACVALLFAASAVLAAAAPVEFDIPADRADRALMAFASQANVQFLAPADPLSRLRSQAVKGSLEPEVAIARLLEGTGFIAEKTGDGKYSVAAIPRGSVAGRLVDEEGRAVRNARLILDPSGVAVSTNGAGYFVFSNVLPGTYSVRTSPSGFERAAFAVTVADASPVDLGTRSLLAVSPPMRMAPYIVQGARAGMPASDVTGPLGVATAAGNLDLPRTQNDALPFAVYGRDRIARSGAVTLNDYLRQDLLEANPLRPPPTSRDVNDIVGSQNLSLRGYSEEETVILVNGRRLPEVLTNESGPRLPDVNFIPLSLVQQVQVLPVSSSALYTGNAVGGVINIVLRPGSDATATELTGIYTNALGGFDAPEMSLSLMHAQAFLSGKLRTRLNLSLTETRPASEQELGFHRVHLDVPASDTLPLHRATPNIRSADGGGLFGTGTAAVTSVAPGADGTGGIAAFAGRSGVRNTALFDGPGGMAVSPESVDYPYGRHQFGRTIYGGATYDAFPWLQLGIELSHGTTRIRRGFDVGALDLEVPASAPTNPFGRDVVVSLNEIPSALGQDFSEARQEASSVVTGAIVRFPANWRANFDLQYASNETRYRGLASALDQTRLDEMIAAGRYNPFRDTQVHAPPQEVYDRVLIYRGAPGRFVPLGNFQTLDAAFRLTNETLFLPTGPAKLNLGADYQRNHIDPLNEQAVYADGSPAGPAIRWSGRTLQRQSFFGELQTSLLPARWLPRFLESAETDIAGRYVFSSNARESNFAPTYGLKLGFAGGVSVRGSLTTSNRLPAPRLSRPVITAAPGTGTSFTFVFDPRRNESYNITVTEAIDPRLRPEAATTQTAGIVWERGRTHHVRLSVDFSDTRKINELAGLDAQTVLNLEPLFPDRVIRAPDAGTTPGAVRTVLTGATNLAWRHSQNWTASLDYAWTGPWNGVFETYARSVYMSRYQLQLYPDRPVVDEIGEPDGLVKNLLRHRANIGVGWSNRSWAFGAEGRYYHSRRLPAVEWPGQGSDRVGSYWQADAYVQTDLGRWLPWDRLRQGLRAQLRVNNVTGRDFPRYANEGSGAGVQAFGDWRGRTYSASITASF